MLNDISQLLFIDLVSFSVQRKVGNIRLQAVQYPTLRMFMYPCTRKKSSFNKRDTKHLLKSLWIRFTLVHQGQEPIWFKSISMDFKKISFYCSRQSHLMVQHFTLWLMKSHVHLKLEDPSFNMQTHQWNVWSTVIYNPWGIYLITCAKKKKKILISVLTTN